MVGSPFICSIYLKVEQQACSSKNMAVHMTGDIAKLETFVYVKKLVTGTDGRSL